MGSKREVIRGEGTMRVARDIAVPMLRSRGPARTLTTLALLLGSSVAIAPLAATPPATVNYQGVLRDQNDVPLSGTYDVVLQFCDSATFGNVILEDQHVAASANAVSVGNGLFTVAL